MENINNEELRLKDEELEKVSGGCGACGRVVVIKSECIECGSCLNLCPTMCITVSGGQVSINGAECVGCGNCYNTCPWGCFAFL